MFHLGVAGVSQCKLKSMKLTRRQLAAAVLASAAVEATAQTQPTPDDEIKAARDRLKSNSDILSRQAIPMATEPAFRFKA